MDATDKFLPLAFFVWGLPFVVFCLLAVMRRRWTPLYYALSIVCGVFVGGVLVVAPLWVSGFFWLAMVVWFVGWPIEYWKIRKSRRAEEG